MDGFKRCTKCGEEKPLVEFAKREAMKDGRYSWCRSCKREATKNWAKTNPEKVTASSTNWYNKNKHLLKDKRKEYLANYYKQNSEKIKKTSKKWAEKNKEKRRKIAVNWLKKNRRKKKNNPTYWLNLYTGNAIRASLNGNKKGRKWESLVGYSISKLKKHIEKQFVGGMSWDNYGDWHIDHVLPLSKFNFEKPEDEDFKKAWSLKNLQPLWAKDNIRKSNKLDKPLQNHLIFK